MSAGAIDEELQFLDAADNNLEFFGVTAALQRSRFPQFARVADDPECERGETRSTTFGDGVVDCSAARKGVESAAQIVSRVRRTVGGRVHEDSMRRRHPLDGQRSRI